MKGIRWALETLSILGVLGFVSGCEGGKHGHGGEFSWNSLTARYACERDPGQQDRVLFLVFCEDHPLECCFWAGEGGKMKLSDGRTVQLSFAREQQFWIDRGGKVTPLKVPFTPEEVKKLVELSLLFPQEDIRSIDDVRALLSGNP